MIKFTVYGEPTAQGRPQGTVLNGKVRMYDPAKSSDYKKYVGLIASQHRPTNLIESAVSLTVNAFMPIPRSWSKKKQDQAKSGEIRPTSKPDIDNITKSILDSLSGIIWTDDRQVVELTAGKKYSESPRIEIEISKII